MYKSIHLNSEGLNNYITEPSKELANLSKINIFIGPNNSGKSSLLRNLFSNKKPEFTVENINLNSAISHLHTQIEDYFKNMRIRSAEGVELSILKENKFLSDSNKFTDLYTYVEGLTQINFTRITYTDGSVGTGIGGVSQIANEIRTFASDCLKNIESLKSYNHKNYLRENIYIPTLRGLRGIDYDEKKQLKWKDNYLIRTKNDYFQKEDHIESQIFTGLKLYDDVKTLLLGSKPGRERVKGFEKFIGDTFFDGKEFSIIPHIEDNVVHIKIGDDDEYPIYKIGDGIQSIIILTYPLFFNQEKHLNVFYEEPDLFLHPGFQRVFLETLSLPQFSNFQFYLTTHSNHFLDMTLDYNSISVFTFQKNDKKEFVINNVSNSDKNILQILGVKNSSVFLSNCTIWVEGITDRIYVRKYLELFQQLKGVTFKEDIHYSFVEYGGGNITHWSFLEDADTLHPNINIESLCSKLFLISDKDSTENKQNGDKSEKLIRQENLKKNLGEQYYCLESREIENLLEEDIIKKVINEFEKSDGNDIDSSKLLLPSYKNEYLGQFIDENVIGLKRAYRAKSGTITNKVEFAKKAVSYMNNYDSISKEAKILTEKIYAFIKGNN